MKRLNTVAIFVLTSLAGIAAALDDIPVYLDADCSNSGIPKSYAQGPSDMNLPTGSNGTMVPITCTEALNGTDAMVIKLDRSMQSGEYWDLILKFADDTQKHIVAYIDLRMMIKNKLSTPAKFRVMLELATYQSSTAKDIEIPAGQGWTESVFQLSDFGITADNEFINGVKFSHPLGEYGGPDLNAGPIDILIDSLRITDGSGTGTIVYPASGSGALPQGWPSTFLVGTYDNFTIGTGTDQLQGKVDYRYQYIMHETWSWASDIGKTFSETSASIGLKTGFVWYYLGKASEGEVAKNLSSSSFMTTYFDEYDKLLDGMAKAGQSDYIIVLEPDMYGLLMQGGHFIDMDAASVPVAMDRANQLSGRSYPANFKGWAQYMIARAREKLPKGVIIGHMLNHWGVNIPDQIGNGRIEAHIMGALAQGDFINSMGAEGKGDVIFVEKADRDAGTKGEIWSWDSTNYARYFLWIKLLSSRANLRVAGWQVSEGNMNHPVAANRDDAVQYFMDHPALWAKAGFIGILFGPGMDGQGNYMNDNGWFLNQMQTYQGSRFALESQSKTRISRSRQFSPQLKSTAAGITFTGFKGNADLQIFELTGKTIYSGIIKSGSLIRISENRKLLIVKLKCRSGTWNQSLFTYQSH